MAANDAFGQHEVLDRTHVVASMFEEFVLSHGWVQTTPELLAEAEKISDALGDFYQQVGRASDAVKP